MDILKFMAKLLSPKSETKNKKFPLRPGKNIALQFREIFEIDAFTSSFYS